MLALAPAVQPAPPLQLVAVSAAAAPVQPSPAAPAAAGVQTSSSSTAVVPADAIVPSVAPTDLVPISADSLMTNRGHRRQLTLVAQSYRSLPNDTLVRLLELRDQERECLISSYRARCDEQQRAAIRDAKLIKRLSDEVARLKGAHENVSQFQITRGPKNVKLTVNGSTALAVRRNMANVAASAFGAITLEDVSQWTVCRAEVTLGMRLVASFNAFHRQYESDIVDQLLSARRRPPPSCPSVCCLAVHRFRSDATNGSVWQKSKLLTTELESIYVCRDAMALRAGYDDINHAVWSSSPSMRRVLDLQVVSDGSGDASYNMLRKVCMLAGFGWLTPHPPCDGADESIEPPTVVNWRLIMYISDGGPDQVGFKKLLKAALEHARGVTLLDLSCLHHMHSLIQNDILK
ncbi:unnamed protein product, partial [Prorocentrum cordatum]